jgi:hypothetical protein
VQHKEQNRFRHKRIFFSSSMESMKPMRQICLYRRSNTERLQVYPFSRALLFSRSFVLPVPAFILHGRKEFCEPTPGP